jgi:glycosyltransferase involved in cell wall biosynthesis
MTSHTGVLHLIDSGGLYGAENVVINLSSGLKKEGHRSVIGCFSYPNKARPDIAAKAQSLGLETVIFELKNKFDFFCAHTIAAYCKKNNIALIHSHGYKPSLFCLTLKMFYRMPYVVTCHLWYVRNARLQIYVFLEKISMLFASRVIGVSEEITGQLQKAGIRNNKLKTILNGIDLAVSGTAEPYDETRLRSSLGLRKNSFIIGSLGRLTEQKDYGTFIRAAAELLKERQDIEFIIAGNGELQANLAEFSQQLGIADRVHLLGFRDDKEALLRLMDIFVLSSLDEGLPIAMLEAMGLRLPVIVTKVGGIPKVIKNGENGILIEKQNPLQLAEAILLLINNDHMKESLGDNAFKTVRDRYSNERMTAEYIEEYRKACGQIR